MTDQGETILIPLFWAFAWFDEGLQTLLREAGWDAVSRPQTMVLIAVGQGIARPAEIARTLAITRQSAGATIAEMVAAGLIELTTDPDDRRAKIVRISAEGERRRADSRAAMTRLVDELEQRIGKDSVAGLSAALRRDWGPPLTVRNKIREKQT
ncbi:DNA-binding MarR family transcriptional regulator [Novosphingobium kunmingense]|uniref:DNA-binding MarR family transcriptional regulator n=1 Tax=Novosphingobium kunmingense TaxID=1211806 RepID=A0A2N0H3B2_9SPHN|nr:MarR family winged helix-turn-helix transcriptional regulator [Novosphingobium kunmingense]PKB13421.1 DNA-binding MarR family transcriptional regulator [Novosphingobium kunmingense]